MFVVMKLEQFSFEASNCRLPITIEKGKLKGFLPVYDSLEDAMLEYPDSEYIEIRMREER